MKRRTTGKSVPASAGILTGPDGNLVAAVVVCFTGALEEGERVLAPLRRFGSAIGDTIASCSYTAMQTLLDGAFPPGRLNYWRSSLTDRISDEAIGALVDFAARMPSPLSVIVSTTTTGPTAVSAKPRPYTTTGICGTTSSSSPTGPMAPTRSGTSAGPGGSIRRCSPT